MRSIKIADGIDFDHLVEHTNGYSGADIATVCEILFCKLPRFAEKLL
jgi:ATP-dependent 26S proteasome regulatory subunit